MVKKNLQRKRRESTRSLKKVKENKLEMVKS